MTGFDQHQSPVPGTHVIVIGELRSNNFNTQILQVNDMESIRVVDDEVMSPYRLRNGFRIPPRDVLVQREAPVAADVPDQVHQNLGIGALRCQNPALAPEPQQGK